MDRGVLVTPRGKGFPWAPSWQSTKTRESLESIRVRLGSAVSSTHLVASTAVGLPTGSPQYLAVGVFLDRMWMTKGRVVISERDAILSSLRALSTEGTTSPG